LPENKVVVVSLRHPIQLEPSLSNGIAPARPELTVPVAIPDTSLLLETPPAKGYSTVGVSRALDFTNYVLLVHLRELALHD
jgi:hypothetical protein